MPLTTKLPASTADFFALTPSDDVQSKALAASVAESFTVPADALYVAFSCTANFYANYATTATVPGDVTDGTASELNPSIRKLRTQAGAAIQSISVISPDACVITASFYKTV